MGQEGQGTRRHLPGVQLLERSCGGVARIGEGGQTFRVPLFIELGESFVGHEDFSAHFQHGGSVCRKGQGNGADGAHVGRYVVPHLAVPARGRITHAPVAVHDGQGHAVDLGFHGDGNGVRSQRPDQLIVEFHQFLVRNQGVPLFEDVVNGEHRNGVPDLIEPLEGGAPYAPRGGIRVRQFGMVPFQFFQFQEKGVVLRVGDFRFRLFIIQPVMAAQLRAQKFRAPAHGFLFRSVLPAACQGKKVFLHEGNE